MLIVHTNDDSIENVHITVYHMCDLITSHRSNRWLKWIGMMWWMVCITQWYIITHMISFIASVISLICNHISVIFIRMSTQRLFINWINLLSFFLSTIVSFVWTAIKTHLTSIIITHWTIISLQNLQRFSFTAATFLSICYVIQSKKVFPTQSVRQDVVHRRLNIGPNTNKNRFSDWINTRSELHFIFLSILCSFVLIWYHWNTSLWSGLASSSFAYQLLFDHFIFDNLFKSNFLLLVRN